VYKGENMIEINPFPERENTDKKIWEAILSVAEKLGQNKKADRLRKMLSAAVDEASYDRDSY